MNPKIYLVAFTTLPLDVMYVLWENSRNPDFPIKTVFDVRLESKPEHRAAKHKLFRQLLESDLPVAENVSFTFLLEGVSVRLREQMVRHRVGHKYGEQLAVDVVPDVGSSSWWSQSMRVLDMGRFAANKAYHVPESVRESKATLPVRTTTLAGQSDGPLELSVEEFYHEQMGWIQSAYRRLRKAGIPEEDCAEILPLATCHTISWTLNLQALKHVVGKRGCWILQLGLWKPVIEGMIGLLAENLDPCFRELISPPCVRGDEFTGCKFKLDNEKRIMGVDPLPPCRLYTTQHNAEAQAAASQNGLTGWRVDDDGAAVHPDSAKCQKLIKMETDYAALWGRSVTTGVRVPLTVGGV